MKVDKHVLAKTNKKNVIDVIRTQGPINKAEIARQTELSIPTVMKITDEFIASGLVKLVGKRVSNGGKRPELLEFAGNAAYILGVDIGRSMVSAIIMDLAGRVIEQDKEKTVETLPAQNVIHQVISMIQTVLSRSGIDKEDVLGIGIAIPGLLDAENGTVLFSPDFGWKDVNFAQPIQCEFQLPIQIENSNRAKAMGESWFGTGQLSSYFVAVNLGYGIGAAIIEHGELYYGSCGSSGELGHIMLKEDGPLCDCGNRGCLEALASGNAIAKTAQERLLEGESSIMPELAGGNISGIDAKIVFDAAKQNDALANEIVSVAAKYIGIGLANFINLIDPDMIVLSGGLVKAGPIFVDRIKEVTRIYQMKCAGRKVKIVISSLGDEASAIGAACLILKRFIECGGNRSLQ